MSRTVMADVNGFTPVIDTLVKEVGLLTATVFGVVWRHCQMEDGFCWASQEKLADIIGVSRQTINEHIKKLSGAGYLEEVGYGTNGVVKLFDTGKANLKLSLSGVVQTDSGCRPNRQPPVVQTDTKIVIKKVKETIVEPELEDCDIDGIPDSWKENKNKINVKSKVKQLAEVFESVAKIARPPLREPKDYRHYSATWWQPLERMLEQGGDDSERFIQEAVDALSAKKYSISSPKSIETTFIGLSSAEKRTPKRMAKDADGNWREV